MKNLSLFIIVFLLLPVTTIAKDGWFQQTSGTTDELLSVHFIDDNTGWIGGINGILKTTDGGETWTEQLTGQIFSIHFVDINNGWACGSFSGGISNAYRTTNGGDDWIEMNTYLDEIYSVFFTDVNNGWIAGWVEAPPRIVIIGTKDGGITWLNEQYIGRKSLKSIYFADDTTGWAVGDSGTILCTTNGGVSFIEEEEIYEIPANYNLSQNYPNPFNPSTKIRYSIPQSSNVVIEVFDILGNEIETLVSEEKTAGTYEKTLYAENLPSGVYFYRLQAGSFVEIKKMVLLK